MADQPETATQKSERLNVRQLRARTLANVIMHQLQPYIAQVVHGHAAVKLEDLLMDEGIEILTDSERKTYGLPERGPDGWTDAEIHALEQRRLKAINAPLVGPGRVN